MQQYSNESTRQFLFLVYLIFIPCVLAFGYIFIGDDIVEYIQRPAPVKSTYTPSEEELFDEVKDGINVQTGLIYAKGFETVRRNCTSCHSPKLIIQNRATKEGWKQMITWMQETQGLWDLGKNEAIILDYLSTNYAPEETGRRANLEVEKIEWFVLELDEE